MTSSFIDGEGRFSTHQLKSISRLKLAGFGAVRDNLGYTGEAGFKTHDKHIRGSKQMNASRLEIEINVGSSICDLCGIGQSAERLRYYNANTLRAKEWRVKGEKILGDGKEYQGAGDIAMCWAP